MRCWQCRRLLVVTIPVSQDLPLTATTICSVHCGHCKIEYVIQVTARK